MNAQLKSRIIGHLKNLCSPDMIMIFGSFSRGEENKNSDLDLIVVRKQVYRKKMLERQIETCLKKYGLKSDILIRSTDELQEAITDRNSFLGSVIKKGIIIYKTNDFSLKI